MAIKLELFGENIEAFKRELETLAELVRPVVQATAAPVTITLAQAVDFATFQELHDLVVGRFDREGYEVTITPRDKPPLTAVEAEALVKEPAKTKGRPRLATVETAVKKLKGNGGQEPETDPEIELRPLERQEFDRKYVLDTLGKLVKESAYKAKVLTFAARIAQQHGHAKLVDVPTAMFSDIRGEMKEEFKLG